MNQHEDIPVMKCTENALFFDAWLCEAFFPQLSINGHRIDSFPVHCWKVLKILIFFLLRMLSLSLEQGSDLLPPRVSVGSVFPQWVFMQSSSVLPRFQRTLSGFKDEIVGGSSQTQAYPLTLRLIQSQELPAFANVTVLSFQITSPEMAFWESYDV
jgi:hypothetical protein